MDAHILLTCLSSSAFSTSTSLASSSSDGGHRTFFDFAESSAPVWCSGGGGVCVCACMCVGGGGGGGGGGEEEVDEPMYMYAKCTRINLVKCV